MPPTPGAPVAARTATAPGAPAPTGASVPGRAAATGAPARGPRWRRLLESRWQARLREVTEASLAYHDAAAAPGAAAGPGRGSLHWLLSRATAARWALADVDDALARLAGGRYGLCECCGGTIPPQHLAAAPEARYCPPCATVALPPPPQRRRLTRGRAPISPRPALPAPTPAQASR